MGKVFAGLAVLVVGMLAPIFVLGGIAASASSGGAGSGSASGLAAEMAAAGFENGRLPAEALMEVSRHGSYSCLVAVYADAAPAWMALVVAARVDGVDIEGGWCYRTYEEQLAAWTSRQCYIPGNCDGDPYPPTAEPGTSNHGWGLAIDVWGASDAVLSCSSPEFVWLQMNGPLFGWVHPEWAACGQSGEEPWHWEFQGVPTVGAGASGVEQETGKLEGSSGS